MADVDEQLAWERRQAPRAAAAAIAAGLLTLAAGIYTGIGFRDVPRAQVLEVLDLVAQPGAIGGQTSLRVPLYEFYSDHFGRFLAAAFLNALGALGTGAALAFALALLASGFAASSVGTHAGQVVMAGFLRRHIPVLVRRLITLAPALLVLGLGGDPTTALVWSQVVLCFGIPFALVPLLWLTSRRDLMGGWVNRRVTTLTGSLVAALIIGLNGYLLVSTVLG